MTGSHALAARRFSMDGENLLNAYTAALLVVFLPWHAPTSRPYFSLSLLVFAAVAAVNHLAPQRLAWLTHGVKAAFTHVLAAAVEPAWMPAAVAVSLVDLAPLVLPASARRLSAAAEGVGATLRLAVVAYGFAQAGWPAALMAAYLACAAAYFVERRDRIRRGQRHAYSALHALEHVAIALFLSTAGADLERVAVALAVGVLPVLGGLVVLGVAWNVRAWRDVQRRAPAWLDPRVRPQMEAKARANALSLRVQNYMIKPFTPKMAVRVVSWEDIESLVDRLPIHERFDVVVGVLSGGAFLAARVAQRLGVSRVAYARSRLWSQLSMVANARTSLRYYLGRPNRTVVTFMDGPPDLTGARVLVVDDSVCTGTTMASVKAACEAHGARVVKTAALVCDPDHPTDFHASQGRTPLIWPWGWESD